jgi:toxin ParE1/3/4
MKPLKINWTPQSQEDLKGVRAFIARNAPITAELFVRRLKSSVNRLRQFPEIGSIVTEFGNSSVRQIIYGAYRIIYRITPTQIDILTVFHSARMLDDSDL